MQPARRSPPADRPSPTAHRADCSHRRTRTAPSPISKNHALTLETRTGQQNELFFEMPIWESKRTKVFSEPWLQKLKDDQRKLTAEIGVLVSEALPKECSTFVYMNDVWVSGPQCAISLAAALRMQLLNVAVVRAAANGAKQKSEVLYEYVVASTQFRQ